MRSLYRIVLCLVLVFLFVGVVNAYTNNFQNGLDDEEWVYWNQIGGASGTIGVSSNVNGEGTDVYCGWMSDVSGQATSAIMSGPSAPVNYVAFTAVYRVDGGNGFNFCLFDSGRNIINQYRYTNAQIEAFGIPNGVRTRVVISRINQNVYISVNGGANQLLGATTSTQPYFMGPGVQGGWPGYAYWYIDDFVSGESITDVVGLPPHTWFVGKDMLDPSLKGLFDSSFNNVYTSYFHYTISNTTGTGLYHYDIPDPPTSGKITVTSGDASDYIDCKSVLLTGTDISFDNTSYILGASTKLCWTIAAPYWLPTYYTYQIKVYKYDPDTAASTLDTNIPISSSSGSGQTYTPAAVGYYYAALIANPIAAPTTDYTLDFSDLISVVSGIHVGGYTYDGLAAIPLGGVSVGIKQNGVWHNTTSDSGGLWESDYTFTTGTTIYFYGDKTNYQTAQFNYTWTSPITAQVDLTLIPSFVVNPNPDPVIGHNSTALGGFVQDSSGTKLSGATVTGGGKTWTTSGSGIWLLDDLTANTVYTVNASLAGYVPLSHSMSTGDNGTIMYYNFVFGPTNGTVSSTSVGGYTIDATTSFPLASVTMNLSNASVPTSIATSSAGGYYQYGALEAGSPGYTLSAFKTAYQNQSTGITTGGQNTITYYNFYMVPTSIAGNGGAALAGFVADASSFSAITDATLTLSNGTTTNSSSPYGAYLFDGVSDTTQYTITASKSGYTSQTKTVTSLISPGVVYTNFYLTSNTSSTVNGTTIYGLITSAPFNMPMDGATVTCTGQNSTTSNAVGFYKFENLNPTTAYTLSASKSGYTSGSDATATKTTGAANTAVQQDLILEQTFLVNVDVRDYTSNALLSVACEVTVNDADPTTTSGGKTSYNLEYGTYTFAATCEGYYAGSTSATIANAQTVTIYMYKIPDASNTTAGSGRQYPANEVQINFMDRYGRDISGVSVNATPINSTMPSNWLNDWLGISIATNPPNSTPIVGITDSHGQVSFIMIKEQLYKLTCVDQSQGINQTFYLYPSQSAYLFTLNTTATNLTAPISGVISYSLANTTINSTHSNLTLYYIDSASSTTNLSFWVKSHNSPLSYCCQTYVPCTSGCSAGASASYTCPYSGGTDYTYGFTAISSTYGTVSHSTTVTYEKLIDLGIPEAYYPWIAAIFLFILAGFFSIISVRFAAIIIPAIAYLFFMMKWISLGPSTAIILGVLFAIGILSYVRKQEDRVS